MKIIPRGIKLNKEGFQDYSFQYKGEKYRIQYLIQMNTIDSSYYQQGWQIATYSDNMPILDFLTNTRKDALNTFLFNNA